MNDAADDSDDEADYTKMDLGRMAIDYVRDNMNVFGESEPVQAMMERMMPNGVDILSAIDNFKQKYE